jgi:hypothetical protein
MLKKMDQNSLLSGLNIQKRELGVKEKDFWKKDFCPYSQYSF